MSRARRACCAIVALSSDTQPTSVGTAGSGVSRSALYTALHFGSRRFNPRLFAKIAKMRPYVQKFLCICPSGASAVHLRRIAAVLAMSDFGSSAELRGAVFEDILGRDGLTEEEQDLLKSMVSNANKGVSGIRGRSMGRTSPRIAGKSAATERDRGQPPRRGQGNAGAAPSAGSARAATPASAGERQKPQSRDCVATRPSGCSTECPARSTPSRVWGSVRDIARPIRHHS